MLESATELAAIGTVISLDHVYQVCLTVRFNNPLELTPCLYLSGRAPFVLLARIVLLFIRYLRLSVEPDAPHGLPGPAALCLFGRAVP